MTDDLLSIARAQMLVRSPLERYRAVRTQQMRAEHVAFFAGGVPGADANFAFVYGPIAPDTFFAQADAFFGGAGAYSVAIEVESAPAVVAVLEAGGWEMEEEEPALVLLELPPTIPSPPAGLTIRRVTDEPGLEDFRTVTGTGTAIIPSLAAATDPGVACFVGYVDGVPAATARLVCLGSIVEITGIVTVPAHRRRGYGTALTWAAIAEGAARGCTTATLTATPLGYPVYLHMGFQRVCTYRTYLPPAPSPSPSPVPGVG